MYMLCHFEALTVVDLAKACDYAMVKYVKTFNALIGLILRLGPLNFILSRLL